MHNGTGISFYAGGGTDSNSANLNVGNITGNFIGNSGDGIYSQLYNDSNLTIGDITGDFIRNWEGVKIEMYSGLSNDSPMSATIGNITGNFINNNIGLYFMPPLSDKQYITVGDITGDFIGNGEAFCIYSGTVIHDIRGNFINNGSAIHFENNGYNALKFYAINSITGDFIGNNDGNGWSYGAIGSPSGTIAIKTVNGNFVKNNYADYATIYSAYIDSLTGDFIGNSARGATVSQSIIFNLRGDFIGNKSNSTDYYDKGIIGNYTKIASLTGDFINNSKALRHGGVIGTGDYVYGNNEFEFVGLVADNKDIRFYNNTAGGEYNDVTTYYLSLNADTGRKISFGGSIEASTLDIGKEQSIFKYYDLNNTYKEDTIDRVTGGDYYFNNTIAGSKINIFDGAKVHLSSIKQADGTTTYGNVTSWTDDIYGSSDTYDSYLTNDTNGGLLDTVNNHIDTNTFDKITLNSALNLEVDVDIANQTADTFVTKSASSGTLNLSKLNFTNGSIEDIIDQNLTITVLDTQDGNLQLSNGFNQEGSDYVLSNETETIVKDIVKDVNWTDTFGTFEKTTKVLGNVDVVTLNTTNDSIGVTVKSIAENTIQTISIDTLKAINQFETTDDRTFTASASDETYTVTDDIGESASGNLTVQGVADGETRSTIDFDNHTGFELDNNDTTLTLKNAKIKNADALVSGTATENVKVVLDNVDLDGSNGGISTFGDVEIKGNSTISDNVTVFGANSTVDIDGTDEVTLDSALTGAGTSTLAITNGTINLTQNAQVTAFDTTITDANLNIAKESSLAGLNTTFEGTNNLNIANDSVGTLALGNVNLNGLVKMQVDADLAGKQMDKLTATSATVNGGSIEVNKINLLSPTTDTKTSLLFTNNTNLANVVSYTGEGTIAYSPIFKYKTSYSVRDGQGYFDFVLPSKPGPGPSPSPTPSDFNPAILATPVMAQAGMQASMNMTMNYAFQHSDGFTKLRAMDRFASINKNKYALSTDFNENLSKMGEFYENKGAWVRPYASFENVRLKNGPRVDAISYGTLVGFDTDFKELRHGWDTIFTGYLGYNGAHLSYPNTSTTMNGGVLGGTQTWYKGNFWTALTATTGASVAESNTMYGHESNVSIMAGVGSKTGYNFEFADGRFIMQPIWFMNYSMIKTIDYTNAAGVRIDSDPLHTIQLNPSIRFIGNLNHGWQPYASVGMVWNLMNKTHVEANGVRLPEMSVKPYVEYGVGVQKQIGDRFTGYFQAMMRNGGRNGIALTGGFRWALGRDGKPIEKVQNGKPVIKVQNSTRKILKSFSKSNVI